MRLSKKMWRFSKMTTTRLWNCSFFTYRMSLSKERNHFIIRISAYRLNSFCLDGIAKVYRCLRIEIWWRHWKTTKKVCSYNLCNFWGFSGDMRRSFPKSWPTTSTKTFSKKLISLSQLEPLDGLFLRSLLFLLQIHSITATQGMLIIFWSIYRKRKMKKIKNLSLEMVTKFIKIRSI